MQNRTSVNLENFPKEIISKIAKDSSSEQQLLLTSKSLEYALQTTSPTIRIGQYVFNKLLFEKITTPRNKLDPYMTYTVNAEGCINKIKFHNDFYKKDQLVCQMMEDKGFYKLISTFCPWECKSLKRPMRIMRSILGGTLGLIASCVSFAIIFPIALIASTLLSFIPLKMADGVSVLCLPICIFNSTIKSVYTSYESSRPLKGLLLVCSLFPLLDMLMWCATPIPLFAGYNDPWKSLEGRNQTFMDITLNWRKKHKKPKIDLPPCKPVVRNSSYGTLQKSLFQPGECNSQLEELHQPETKLDPCNSPIHANCDVKENPGDVTFKMKK